MYNDHKYSRIRISSSPLKVPMTIIDLTCPAQRAIGLVNPLDDDLFSYSMFPTLVYLDTLFYTHGVSRIRDFLRSAV